MTIEAFFSSNRLRYLLCLSLAGLCGTPVRAAQPLGCLIEPERTAEIGSQVVGVIEAINVERGDRVSKGQVLAVLHAQSERAAVGVAKAKLDADAEVRAAEVSAAFARQQYQRSEDLFEKNFISRQALDQARTEADVSQQKLSLARQQKRVTDRELSYVQAQLAQRQIHSPFDGIVAERYLSPGERVEEKPLLRLAQVNPLRVQVVAPVGLYGQIAVGDTAAVLPEMPNSQTHTATVVQVDKIVDPASNTFRVILRLPNPDFTLPAGLRCKADFAAGASRPTPPKVAAAIATRPTPPTPPANAPETPTTGQPAIRQTAVPEAKASAALINVPSMPIIAATGPATAPVDAIFSRPSAIATANADYYAARAASKPTTTATPSVLTMPVTAAPATATPTPSTQPVADDRSASAGGDHGEIEKTLERWRTAWSNKDLAAYLACYHPDFRTPGGRPLAAWANERRRRFAESSPIQVHYDQLQVTLADPGHARVRFRQHYRSGDETFISSRLLKLVHSNGQWLIVGEQKQD